jgi:hypothetical protein
MLSSRSIGQCRRRYGAARGRGAGEERARGGALGDADVGMPCFCYGQRRERTRGRCNRRSRRSGVRAGRHVRHVYRRIATVRVLGYYEGARATRWQRYGLSFSCSTTRSGPCPLHLAGSRSTILGLQCAWWVFWNSGILGACNPGMRPATSDREQCRLRQWTGLDPEAATSAWERGRVQQQSGSTEFELCSPCTRGAGDV